MSNERAFKNTYQLHVLLYCATSIMVVMVDLKAQCKSALQLWWLIRHDDGIGES